MKIGEVSRRLNMPASTIRYYEKRGLLNPDRISGKREFDSNALVKLQFVQLCQAAGFSIVEIRKLLANYAQDSSRQGPWFPAVEVKLAEIREQIDKLQRSEALLNELVECRCKTIEQCVSNALADTN